MANEETEDVELFEKNVQYVDRLLYDVLVVTLPICGLPETCLPVTNYEANIYESTDFLDSACAAVLTRSLCIRNEWSKHLWISILSKENDSGFDYEYIPVFLYETFASFQKKKAKVTNNFLVEMSFGFCSEIILYIYHQKIDFDFNKLMNSISKFIVSAVASDLNILEIIDELFLEFDDASLYMKWITDFTTEFAIPYGSRDDIPELFKKCFDKIWKSEFEDPTRSDTPLVIKLRNPAKFSLQDALSDIAAEVSLSLQKSSKPESVLQKHPKSPKLNESTGNVSLGDGKPCKKLSNQTVNKSSENGNHSSKPNGNHVLGIEDDLEQMSLSTNGTC